MTRIRQIACFVLGLAVVARLAAAQTAAAAPRTIPMARDWALDAPNTWVSFTAISPDLAFVPKTDAAVIGALQHVGQRPTDVPYVVVEHMFPATGMDSVSGRHEIAERIADYYRTACIPPSKADRSPSWKRSKVSPITYDAASGQFRFDATITYDTIGDLHVVVSGLFNTQRVIVLAGWSDPAFDAANPGQMSAIRDSLHMIGANTAPVVSPAESLRTFVQIVVGLIVVAVIVLQVVVWQRDRRARDGDAVELI